MMDKDVSTIDIILKALQKEKPIEFKQSFGETIENRIDRIISDIKKIGEEFGYKVDIKYWVSIK